MLKELQIRNFALIEELELSFYSGFSVLSGETGAGKSIIIDALGLLLGDRASLEMIRTGADSTLVSGSFSYDEDVASLLDEWGMLAEGELILAREINLSGRNKCWINGRLATVSQLSTLGPHLVDIVGQHDSQSLLNSHGHAQLLDTYGGDNHLKLLKQTNQAAEKWLAIKAEQRRLQKDDRERNRRIDLLVYQLEEIENANLQPGEDGELQLERSRLANLDRIRHSLHYAVGTLGETYEERESLLNTLSSIEAELNRASTLDSSLEGLTQRYLEVSINLHDLYAELRDYLETLPADPSRLNAIEERLDLIDGLKRKYGPTVEEILAYAERAQEELTMLENASERAEGLEEESLRWQEIWKKKAALLTESRKKSALQLEQQIEEQLADLSMESTRFKVQFSPAQNNSPRLGGQEDIEFMMAANLGEELKPLAKIASGGELSRVMLAIKAILVEAEQTPTVIFDEIDAGIGGRTAVALGEKLQSLSKLRQVLCVTHLPQVASYGTHHYSVRKISQGERTSVEVGILQEDERVEELTRMLGGTSDERVTSEHARQLLRKTLAW